MQRKERKGKERVEGRTTTHGHLKVPQHLGVVLGDDADVDVGSGSQIVEDTGGDGFGDHLDGFLSLKGTDEQQNESVSFEIEERCEGLALRLAGR